MREIIFIISSIVFNVLKILPIKKNRVIMECDYGKGFYGNLLYIYEEIKRRELPLEIIIPVNRGVNIDIQHIGNVKYTVIHTRSLKHLYYLATSRYWITNNHYYHFLKKRSGTTMINTWHAMGAFKKFGIDSAKTDKEIKRFLKDGKNIDYLLVSSNKVKSIYSKALGVEEEKILSLGIPRTDPLFNEDYIEKVKSTFLKENVKNKGKKIILYAPTFRDDEKEHFNMELDLRKLKSALGEEYVVLLKLHPIIRNPYVIEEDLKDFVFDFSKENINNLMMVSDVLITDYSSVIFEYSLLKKPIIFFAYDYEKYKNNLRDFYFDYKDFIPGNIAMTTEEVIENLNKIECNSFNIERIIKFSTEFCEYRDGNSSKRFVDEFLLK